MRFWSVFLLLLVEPSIEQSPVHSFTCVGQCKFIPENLNPTKIEPVNKIGEATIRALGRLCTDKCAGDSECMAVSWRMNPQTPPPPPSPPAYYYPPAPASYAPQQQAPTVANYAQQPQAYPVVAMSLPQQQAAIPAYSQLDLTQNQAAYPQFVSQSIALPTLQNAESRTQQRTPVLKQQVLTHRYPVVQFNSDGSHEEQVVYSKKFPIVPLSPPDPNQRQFQVYTKKLPDVQITKRSTESEGAYKQPGYTEQNHAKDPEYPRPAPLFGTSHARNSSPTGHSSPTDVSSERTQGDCWLYYNKPVNWVSDKKQASAVCWKGDGLENDKCVENAIDSF